MQKHDKRRRRNRDRHASVVILVQFFRMIFATLARASIFIRFSTLIWSQQSPYVQSMVREYSDTHEQAFGNSFKIITLLQAAVGRLVEQKSSLRKQTHPAFGATHNNPPS